MASRVITYDRWAEEYGEYGPRWAGSQRDNGVGLFTALNMVVYKSGIIGPRPGLKAYTWSSVPTGALTGLFDGPFPGETCLFSVDDDLYHADSEQATDTVAVVSSGTFDASTTQVEGTSTFSSQLFLTSLDDKSYVYTNGTDELGDLSDDSFGGRAIVLHGERLFVSGGTFGNDPPWRIQYSDATDFDAFDALNYYDIYGAGGAEISNLISLGSRLIIQSEDDLWLYQGVPGLESLRKILRVGIGVSRVPGAIVAAGDELWYVTRNGTLGWGNGSVADGRRWERLVLGTEDGRAVYDPFADVVLIVGDGGAGLMRRQNVWTRHEFPSSITNLACNRYVPGTRTEGFVLTNGGGASTAATFYALVNDIERPGFTSDTFASVGDGSTTPNDQFLHLPEYRPAANQEITVREVKVDFVKWQTGAAATNHFDVTVRVWSLYDTESYRDSTVLSFDEPGANTYAGTSGTDERANFTFGDQGSGSGFQILIDNIRGCGIRSISVTLDETTGRAG